MMKFLDFETIASQYDAFFFDAYGVLKDSSGLVAGIEKTFEWLEANDKGYLIITNDASRSPDLLAEAYHSKGLHAINADRIVSSGMLAKEFLDMKVNDGMVAYLGTVNSAHYIDATGLHTIPVAEINDENVERITALVLLDDEGFNWFNDINKVVNLLRRRPIPAIVANPDRSYPVNRNEVSVAIGSLAAMIEHTIGKKFIRFGKPDSQIFMFAYEKLMAIRRIHRKKILMVGDTLTTDVLGGNKFGLDTALVLTGNTLPAEAEGKIISSGIVPTFICETAVI